jgi:hypothetical protein
MDRSTDTTAGHRGRGPKSQDVDWHDLLSRIRKEVRNGADRVEVDVQNDVVLGLRQTGKSHGNN